MSDKPTTENKHWSAQTRTILDQSLVDIDNETQSALTEIRRRSFTKQTPGFSQRQWFAGGIASAACMVVALTLVLNNKENSINSNDENQIQPVRLSNAEFDVMIESMDLIDDMDMLAALGELASET